MGKDACASKGLKMCGKADVCPNGKPVDAAKMKSGQWTAVKEEPRWVESTGCQDHPKGVPAWSEQKQVHAFKPDYAACCGQADKKAPGNAKPAAQDDPSGGP